MKMNRTVKRSFEILEYVAARPMGVTLAEISKELDIPSSSALDIVKTLYAIDCLYYRDEHLKTYAIGSRMYALGSQYTRNSLFLEVSKPYVHKLSNQYNHPVLIGKRVEENLVYVYKTKVNDSIINLPSPGTKEDLHTTGLGKVLIAFSRKRDKLTNSIPLNKRTKYTITNNVNLKIDLDKTLARHCGVGNREYHEHLKDIAVPVFNFENRVVGSIGLFFLTMEEIDEEIVSELKKCARMISKKLGYKGEVYGTIK